MSKRSRKRLGITKNCEWLIIDESAYRISAVDMVDLDEKDLTLDLFVKGEWLCIEGFDTIEDCQDIFDRVINVLSMANRDVVAEEEEVEDE